MKSNRRWTSEDLMGRVESLAQSVRQVDEQAWWLRQESEPPGPKLMQDLQRTEVPLRLRTDASNIAGRVRVAVHRQERRLMGLVDDLREVLQRAEERYQKWGAV